MLYTIKPSERSQIHVSHTTNSALSNSLIEKRSPSLVAFSGDIYNTKPSWLCPQAKELRINLNKSVKQRKTTRMITLMRLQLFTRILICEETNRIYLKLRIFYKKYDYLPIISFLLMLHIG